MSEAIIAKQKNWTFITGILIMCVGMQIANYGTAVCLSGEVNKMGATQYYVLISCLGSLGMMLILPLVGKLTAIVSLRTMIIIGIFVQLLGRICMIFTKTWIPYSAGYLIQSIGGGFYISSAYVNMTSAVDVHERTKFFGYITMANAVGAIFGPVAVSALYDMGGISANLAYICNLPFTLLGFLMIYKNCSTHKTPGAAKDFDYLGLVLSVLGIACLVFWMNLGGKMFAWASAPSLIMLAISMAFLAAMIKRELQIDNPAVPIRMFKNSRLTFAFIGAVVAAAFSTCSSAYGVMWVRINYSAFPGATLFNGMASLPQQVVMVILGMFLGAFIGQKFVKRFRVFGILAMIAAMVATGLLFCLKFTGTAADSDIITIGGTFPVGMLIIWTAVAIGGFTSVVAQSTFSVFWQTNTAREDIPACQALYNFGSTGGAVVFGAIVGVVIGSSDDYSRAFAAGFVFAAIGLVCAIFGFRFTKEEL